MLPSYADQASGILLELYRSSSLVHSIEEEAALLLSPLFVFDCVEEAASYVPGRYLAFLSIPIELTLRFVPPPASLRC